MNEQLRRTEAVWYGIELAGWAIDRALEHVESKAVDDQLGDAREALRLASEQLANVVAGLPADQRPREDVTERIHQCLSETHEF